MKVVAIIQARTGASRLPGKVLKEVLGKPLLAYQLERVRNCSNIDQILVATTKQKADDRIVSLCEEMDIYPYRGSESDVLGRYYEAANHMQADIIVRLTADCPLIDPSQVDYVIQNYFPNQHSLQYVSNTLKRTFPRGMDTEVFSFAALKETHVMAKSTVDREHVTRYMVNHPETFTLKNVTYHEDQSQHRWTVDTIEDFWLIKRIIETLYPKKPHFNLEDILHLFAQFPDWRFINSHIHQKYE
ncbi:MULTISPECIES: glycosyltransferase family protein [Clostridia]|uniref:cytidylyltransferase domain-containing protein n=1 Tax=Clostridia TaxID=186801 RepID=UPI000EA3658F|nr:MULTISPECIES: glycosyltransferase family protein [Clostridia]NBJ68076.1 acylneuraminate cytidylyltransferase [Roseburia sp. 1XD42-34]RKI82517.1 acylneuraminate cytidylyltransferase [Clostridium sp. 1xD42-85]